MSELYALVGVPADKKQVQEPEQATLPYEEVRKIQDARPMMLAKAKDRLGLVA